MTVLGTALALSLFACGHGLPVEDWEILATEYIDADTAVLLARDEETLSSRMGRRDEIALKLGRMDGPTQDELVALLQSKDAATRAKALVVVIGRRRASARVAHALPQAYRENGAFYSRYYVLEALLALPPEVGKSLAPELTPRLIRESNDGVQLKALVYLSKLDASDALPVFIRYMEAGSPAVRVATYGIVRSAGAGITGQLLDALGKCDAGDALRAIAQFEKLAPASLPPPK